MYNKTYSSVAMLNYLKGKTYKGLPFELWDGYLWLYKPVVDLLSKPVTGKTFDNIFLYANEIDKDIKGIAYIERNNDKVDILLDTTTDEGLNELIQDLKKDNCSTIKITVRSKEVAELVKKALGMEYVLGWAYFYAQKCFAEPEYEIKEIEPGDGYLFVNERLPEGWPQIDMCLAEGVRYFTINDNDRSISSCGLCYLTTFRAEVIAVGTTENFRKKGCAKSICSYAMKEALLNAPIVTWTTRLSNEASCATAQSLGFVPFVELHHFEINS